MILTAETLIEIAMTNPANAEIARRLPALGLSQCMLTAGCLFQAVWNHQSGLPRGALRITTFFTLMKTNRGTPKTKSSWRRERFFTTSTRRSKSRIRHGFIVGTHSDLVWSIRNCAQRRMASIGI